MGGGRISIVNPGWIRFCFRYYFLNWFFFNFIIWDPISCYWALNFVILFVFYFMKYLDLMSYVFIKLILVNSGYHCLDFFLMLEKIWPPAKKKHLVVGKTYKKKSVQNHTWGLKWKFNLFYPSLSWRTGMKGTFKVPSFLLQVYPFHSSCTIPHCHCNRPKWSFTS